MIEFKHIRKSYKVGDFEQKALDDVSISFRGNEFVAVLGPSGSGKTTLLNVLGGLDHADTGELVINGVSTKDYASADWDTYRNHHIGFIFQSYNLIPHQTVLSNVELALTLSGVSRAERRKRAMAALERVGLGEHVDKKPNQLSGGQMQRVAIARALVNDPDIVLADEPTGALDTETGIQVMDLLKEIAKDRLVIMVTHNPELAYDYANRIVKLHDGKIDDDSNPFDPTKADEQEALLENAKRNSSEGRKKHASMSFLTALALSFNNLMTKKGRTFLTAFAGSIGIIGIAAILALSNGVNNYIDKVEEDTLSSTPLTITQSSFDVTSIMMQAGNYMRGNDGDEVAEGVIPESTIMADVLADVKTNDLKSLRSFFEEDGGNVNSYVNAIVYGYGITPQIYKADTSDGIKQLNPGALSSIMSNDINSAGMFSTMMGSASSFQEMLDDQKLLEEQYDMVAGAWPSNYDECVLVLNQNGGISDYTLYAMGILDPDELEDLLMDALASEDLDVPDTSVEFTQEEALSLTFKVVNKCDMYTKASSGSTWVDRSDDVDYMKQEVADGMDLKVVGIVKPSATASSTSMDEGIGYRHDLVLHLIEQAAVSPVVEAQMADPSIDIFTGKSFESLKDDAESSFDMSSLFSVDQSAMARAFNVNTDDIQNALTQAMSSAGASIDTSSMFADVPTPDMSKMEIDSSAGMPSAEQAQQMQTALNQGVSAAVSGYMGFLVANAGRYDMTSQAGLSQAFADYRATDQYKNLISQLSSAMSSGSMSEEMQKSIASAVQKTMNDYVADQLTPYLQSKMNGLIQSYSTSLASSMASALSRALGSAVTVDPNMFAQAISVNMDQDELTSMFMNLARSNDLSYENNLQTMGYADIADPISISIYAKSFDDKQQVEDIIDQYNTDMEASGEDSKTISYSDIMGVLMTSVTDIVNMISMVLIAFVAISLVVSSIMIGIITYISVLERKKEIGILRAMGASKLNIANIFNAETVIEGLMSGVFAVVLVALVSIPVNAVILAWKNIEGIMSLPIGAALILIAISVCLTFIAGLMPARNDRGATRWRRCEASSRSEEHEYARQAPADEAAAREGEYPSEDHALGDVPFHPFGILRCAHSHDGGGVAMRSRNGHAGDRGYEQGDHRGERSCDALIFLHLHHVHRDGFDDALSAYQGAQRYGRGAEYHEPEREFRLPARLHPECQSDAQKPDRHEFLPVLGAVQKGEGACADVLEHDAGFAGLVAVRVREERFCQLGVDPAQCEASHQGEYHSVDDEHPLAYDDARDAVHRDSPARHACDQGMRFRSRDASEPAEETPSYRCDHGGYERHQRLVRVA